LVVVSVSLSHQRRREEEGGGKGYHQGNKESFMK